MFSNNVWNVLNVLYYYKIMRVNQTVALWREDFLWSISEKPWRVFSQPDTLDKLLHTSADAKHTILGTGEIDVSFRGWCKVGRRPGILLGSWLPGLHQRWRGVGYKNINTLGMKGSTTCRWGLRSSFSRWRENKKIQLSFSSASDNVSQQTSAWSHSTRQCGRFNVIIA